MNSYIDPETGFDVEGEDDLIDAWHDGWFGKNRPADARLLTAWTEGAAERVKDDRAPRVAPVERPEGYYHAPIGTFD